MAAMARLNLEVTDVLNAPINDRVNVDLFDMADNHRFRAGATPGRHLHVKVPCERGEVFKVRVQPSNYRAVQFNARLAPGKTFDRKLEHPVLPSRVVGIEAPVFEALDRRLQDLLLASDLERHVKADGEPLQGRDLYRILDPVRKAALLNIHCKASDTILKNGRSVFDYLTRLRKLQRDRFYAVADPKLRKDALSDSDLFSEEPDSQHHPPDDNYVNAKSVKTKDDYGNLQLSFFAHKDNLDDVIVDVDIDEASGIEHWFEVARNTLTGHKTHPYDIREILIDHQLISPRYKLLFPKVERIAA